MNIKKLLLIQIMFGSLNGCLKAKNWEWKQESGYGIGDFIDFNAGYYKIDEEGCIYANNQKVAKVIEVSYGIAGTHKMVIKSVTTKKNRNVHSTLIQPGHSLSKSLAIKTFITLIFFIKNKKHKLMYLL